MGTSPQSPGASAHPAQALLAAAQAVTEQLRVQLGRFRALHSVQGGTVAAAVSGQLLYENRDDCPNIVRLAWVGAGLGPLGFARSPDRTGPALADWWVLADVPEETLVAPGERLYVSGLVPLGGALYWSASRPYGR